MGNTYAIVNRKGGTGKTSVSTHLAHGLTLMLNKNGGGRVLLIDIDPQGNAATALGIEAGDRCLSNLLTGQRSIRDVIISDLPKEEGGTGRKGLFLIPASDKLVEATETLLIQDFQSFRRKRADTPTPLTDILTVKIGPIKAHFDFIVIDCPPSLGSLTEAVYHFADHAVVPVRPALLDTTGAAQHTQMINAMQDNGLDITVSLILPTFYDARQILARKVITALQNRYGATKVADPIPNSVVVQQAQAAGGQTVFEYPYAKKNPATLAFTKLVERIYHER